MTGKLHVLIAGGGLSGLALAQGLIKDGHTCDVFERDADDSRKIGYYLHMNADGGEALRRCLPADLFELYARTSRRTYDRRQSIVLDDQLNELSAQPHLGPPNEGERPHTGVHRRTLRSILRARLGGSFHPGRSVTGYKETPDGVSVTFADGTTAQGDVLAGADGIRSAVRGQHLPGTTVIDAGVRGLGVFGRTPLTPELAGQLPPHLFEGVIIAADRKGSRLLIAVYRPRQRPQDAAADVIEHIGFEEFVLTVDGERHQDVVFDHSAAFAAWGPIVVELGQVHAIDDRLAAAYGLVRGAVPGAVSHVSWVVPDVERESTRLARLGCRLINTARSGPISVAWHEGGPLFPHPIELHQHNDVIAGMHDRLAALAMNAAQRPPSPSPRPAATTRGGHSSAAAGLSSPASDVRSSFTRAT